MAAKFVVVPQWQGSASSRSMRLMDGAEAIRGDLPSSATVSVEIPLGAGDEMGSGVHRFSSLAVVRERLAMTLHDIPAADVPIVVGGDCGVELAAIEHAMARTAADGGRLGVVWLDAHPDLNTPATTPSGAFCGMVLRALLGECAPGLVAEPALPASAVVLAGTRSIDDGEAEYLERTGIPIVGAGAIETDLADAVQALDCDRVYLHVDLDVLDPIDFDGLADPQPFGTPLSAVTAAIGAVLAIRPLVGAGITMFSPQTVDEAQGDLPTILRILSAITAGTKTRA